MNQLNGVLVVRKERGYTSNDVVAKLRGILHMKKIGHTGTLDPDAEGVLPVCLGNATKLVDLIADRDKEYIAVLRLGIRTDTQDLSEGAAVLEEIPEPEVRTRILEQAGSGLADSEAGRTTADERRIADEIGKAAESFLGEYHQLTPMYSARKVNGHRLYEYARKGIEVDRKPRTVQIYEAEVQKCELPRVTLRVRCSKGTYIRTLCEDIGARLGTGGAMEHLLRTRVGIFTLEDALTLQEIEGLMHRSVSKCQAESQAVTAGKKSSAWQQPEQGSGREAPEEDAYRYLRGHIRTVESFFSDLPAARTKPEDDVRLRNGNAFSRRQLGTGTAGRLRVCDSDGNFCGLYEWKPEKDAYLPVQMFL